MTVLKGTQYIDEWWRILRKELRNNPKHDTKSVIELVKAARCKTWHQGEDLWLAAGSETVQRCQYRPGVEIANILIECFYRVDSPGDSYIYIYIYILRDERMTST